MNKLYYSREDRVADIVQEEDRVQYKDVKQDDQKIAEACAALDDTIGYLYNAVDKYRSDIASGTPESIQQTRREMVYFWSETQADLSKLAYILRVDGNEAYQRYVEAVKTKGTASMEGL